MRLVLVSVMILTSLSAQTVDSGIEEQNPFAGDAGAIEAGRQTFVETCSACHGQTGEGGRGPSLVGSREVRRATDRQLFVSVRDGVSGTDMPPFPFPEEKLWQVIAFVRSLSAPAFEQPPAGDAFTGESLFFGKATCSQCHTVRGKGGLLGPDLSDVGGRRTVTLLREAVLSPNERLAAGFEAVTLQTADGEELRGTAKYRTNYSMSIIDEKGKMHLLRRDQLHRATLRAGSWMPDDFAERLTEQEVRDLIAFLSRQAVGIRQGK